MSDLESGGEAGGVALPAAADLARELRVLVRLRSPASVKQAELPALRSRCGDDLAGCVDRAIAGIAETKYRAAAEALLGSGDGRWSTLERRGQSAAEAFGLTTYDAYRKPRRSTTTSHMEETLELVAEAMVAHSADAERPPETISDPVSTPRRGGLWNARRGVAAVVVGVVVLAGVIAVLMTRSSGGAEPGRRAAAHPAAVTHSPAATAHCPAKVGDLPPASPPELSRFVAPFHAAVASSGSPPCAAAPIERWQNLIFQRLRNASGHPDGVVIGADPAHVLRLTEAEYSSYHQFGGKNGERAQAIAGLPLSLYADHSASILRTANGGFVSEGRDQPGYFVGSTVWDTWQAGGGATSLYGLATSNPLFDGDGYHQDFEHGTFFLPFNGTLRWQPVADPAAALPPEPVGHILRHDDATTWYVDQQRRRHWIPDGDTYDCLSRKGATQIDGVPGYATATLSLGAPATCR